jgi:hypothetical protein
MGFVGLKFSSQFACFRNFRPKQIYWPYSGERYQDFGGNFNLSRRKSNDGRDSMAVPIVVDLDVVAVINLTWFHNVKTIEQMVVAHLGALKRCSSGNISAA